MTRHRFPHLFVAISTAALLSGCSSSQSNSPVSTVNDSTSPPAPPSTAATTSTAAATSQPPGSAILSNGGAESSTGAESGSAEQTAAKDTIAVTVGSQQFSATLADTNTARAFADGFPLTLNMHDVNSNEKAFELPEALPSDPQNPGTISTGDLMLYRSDTIVLFYESFDTSYTYSRIGQITDPNGLSQALGTGDVTVTFDR